jgi:hypothetical protein
MERDGWNMDYAYVSPKFHSTVEKVKGDLMYKIYTKDNCDWCIKAKSLMNSLGIPYTELKLGRDFNKEDLQKLLPSNLPLKVPQIFVHNSRIGGYEDLGAYFEMHGVMGMQQ